MSTSGCHLCEQAHALVAQAGLTISVVDITVPVNEPGREQVVAGMPAEVFTQTAFHTPLKRVAEPQDIANAVMFLASDMADHITGQYIPVNGGEFMM